MKIKKMVSVQKTFYNDYFEDVEEDTVFLLDEEEAKSAWDQEISPNASSYFDLPNDCWIVKNESNFVANWMEAFNNNENELLATRLRSAVNWDDDATVRFFAKKKIVFQSTWYDFLAHWDDFISVEDDSPILIPNESSYKEALLFRPIGDIRIIRK